jgi:hypothetical protein
MFKKQSSMSKTLTRHVEVYTREREDDIVCQNCLEELFEPDRFCPPVPPPPWRAKEEASNLSAVIG